MSEQKNGYVKWQYFVYILGFVTTLIGGSYAYGRIIDIKVEKNSAIIQENRTDTAVLKSQYTDIKSDLVEIKDLIKKQ